MRIGLRLARDSVASGLGELTSQLSAVRSVDHIRTVAALIPAALGADDVAVSRLSADGDWLEDISRHDWSEPGGRYRLAEYPATAYVIRTRTAGQVVVGDLASDPTELALLEENGFGAMMMIPLVFGGCDLGLLELYRCRAQPFSSGELERAQLLAHQLAAVIDLLERVDPVRA